MTCTTTTTTLKPNGTQRDDTFTIFYYTIHIGDTAVGNCMISEWVNSAHLDRIDVYEGFQGKGIGTAAMDMLSDLHGAYTTAPDNADAQRLYARIGNETDENWATDAGFGVYSIGRNSQVTDESRIAHAIARGEIEEEEEEEEEDFWANFYSRPRMTA